MTDFANIYSKYYKRIYNYLYGQFLHREIAEDVDNTPYAYYFQQAGGGMYVRMAIISYLLGYSL